MSGLLLAGKVALVTGASRGIGRGIAYVLVENGATVYITGRPHSPGSKYKSVMDTAEELNGLKAGKCVGVYCDHAKDEETQKLFETISKTEYKLDILVNNAFAMLDTKDSGMFDDFWHQDSNMMWEKTITVGLRSNYISSCLALKMMVPKREGLIVNISSAGGLVPLFNPLYCVGKEGNDRMSAEMGRILKSKNISVISLWPGMVRTEILTEVYESGTSDWVKRLWSNSESVYFSGRAVLHLALDKNVINKSGKIQIVPDLAGEYGFSDVDGKFPASLFSIKALIAPYMPTFSYFIPHFLRVPKLLLSWWYGRF